MAITLNGNSNVSLTYGSGGRITGDFTNATLLSRAMFQTSTADSTTGIYALPSGTSTAASWQATNNADPTNASKVLIATNGTTDCQLVSGRNGSGTYLPLSFYTNGSQQMQLDTAGNLGLGVTPSAWGSAWKAYEYVGGSIASPNNANNLILQNAYATSANYIYKNSGLASNYQQSAGQHIWNTAASGTAGNAITWTQAMTLDASGNLGIGAVSPTARLHVSGGNAQVASFYGNNANNYLQLSDNNGTNVCTVGSISGGNWYLYTAGYGAFYTGLAERARIDSSGNLLVGTTTSIRKFVVNSGAVGSVEMALTSNNSTGSAYLNVCDVNGSNGGGYTLNLRGLASGGTAQVNLSAIYALATAVYNGSNTSTWNTSSDQRIKKNIVDNNEGLEKITKIQIRNFEYRTEDEIVDFPGEENVAIQKEGTQLGVIAQELQETFPECVYTQKNGVLAISTDTLMWHMVNAIKELTTRLEALEAK